MVVPQSERIVPQGELRAFVRSGWFVSQSEQAVLKWENRQQIVSIDLLQSLFFALLSG
jgi:hypothetical protein